MYPTAHHLTVQYYERIFYHIKDIKVVMALGDSITAGIVFTPYHSFSFLLFFCFCNHLALAFLNLRQDLGSWDGREGWMSLEVNLGALELIQMPLLYLIF
jgi:hypothetical protein